MKRFLAALAISLASISAALADGASLPIPLATANGGLGGNFGSSTGLPLFASGVVTITGTTGTGNIVRATSPTIAGLTVTSSFTATGLVTNSDLANASTTVNGQTCTLGSTCTVTAAASSVAVGTTTIGSGTSNGVLYNNAGVLGNLSTVNNGVLVTNGSGVPSISTTGVPPTAVYFTDSGTGAVQTTVDAALKAQALSITNFAASVCTSDDQTAITTGIAAAAALGKPLYFPACPVGSTNSYYTWDGNVAPPANLYIISDPGVVLKLKASSGQIYGFNFGAVSNVKIENLTLDGNKSAQSGPYGRGIQSTSDITNITIKNVRLTNWYEFGASVGSSGTADVTFDHVTADNNGTDGILASGGSRVNVDFGNYYSNGRYGVTLNGVTNPKVTEADINSNSQGGLEAVGSTNLVATNNRAWSNGTGPGLSAVGSLGSTLFVGNQAWLNGQEGINITVNGSTTSGPLTATGNYVYSNSRVGISVDSESNNSTVTGNTAIGNGWEGISVFRSPNVTIIGNTILNNGGGTFDSYYHYYGIHVWDTSNTPNNFPSNNVKIVGNTIGDTGAAVQHYGVGFSDVYSNSTGGDISDNNFFGNTVGPVQYAAGNIQHASGNHGFLDGAGIENYRPYSFTPTCITNPTVGGDGTAPTYSAANLCYTIVGNIMTVSFDIHFSNKGTGTSYIYINTPSGQTASVSGAGTARLPPYVFGPIFWSTTYNAVFLVNSSGGYPLSTNTDEISGTYTMFIN